MPFTTGTAASWTSLTTAMNAFLTGSLGFTNTYLNGVSESSGAVFDAATWELDGMYWNFDWAPATANGSIRCWMSTGNDGVGVNYGNHTGNPRGSANIDSNATQMNYISFPLDYWFFGDESGTGANDSFYMVVSPAAGTYHHFWIGYIEPTWAAVRPFGAFSGATQLQSTVVYPAMTGDSNAGRGMDLMYYPYDPTPVGPQTSIQNTSGGRLVANWCSSTGMNEQAGAENSLEMLLRGGQQVLTGRSILNPNPAIISNQTNTAISAANRVVSVGQYPDAHMLSLEGLNVEDLITVGPDTYQVFPLFARGNDSDASAFDYGLAGGVGDSGILGFAYRRFA